MDIKKIKESINPRRFYEQELGIRSSKTGWCDGGICPFHADQKAGSFKVNLETGAFKCFSCHARGSDIIAFGQKVWGVDFLDAIKILQRDY